MEENAASLAEIICFLSWKNPTNTDKAQKLLRIGVNDAEHEQLSIWFKLVSPFLSLDDEYRDIRNDYMFQQFMRIIDKFRKYPKFTCGLITNMFDLYLNIPASKKWMDNNVSSWKWVEKWMTERKFTIPDGISFNGGKSTTSSER